MIKYYSKKTKELIQIRKILPKGALLAAAVMWGMSFTVMKGTLDNLPVFALLALRFSFAFIFLAGIFFKKFKSLTGKALWQGAVLGVILFFAYAVQTYGLKLSTPGKNAFLTATYCVIVPFLFWAIAKKRPDRFNVISGLLCIIGVGLVSLGANLTLQAGDGLSVLGGVLYAVHIIFIALYTKKGDPILLCMLQFFFAGCCAWLACIPIGGIPLEWTADMCFDVAYLAVCCTALTFVLQMYGQKYENPSSAALLLSLESVFGIIFSLIAGRDTLTPALICGFALIFAAIILSETKLSFLKKALRKKE